MDIHTIVTSAETSLNWVANNFPDEATTLLLLGTSPLIAVVLKVLHTGSDLHLGRFTLKSDDIKRAVALAVATGVAGINYLQTDPTVGAQYVAVQGVLLHTFNQPYYKLILKPLSRKVAMQVAAARMFNNQKKAAVLPASGLPLTQAVTPAPVEDFSS